MVKMRNIRLVDGLVYMHCLIEGKEDNYFDLCIDPVKKIIISTTQDSIDVYALQAANRIYRIYGEEESIPETASACWY